VAGAVVIMATAAAVVIATRDDPPADGRFAATPDACRSIVDSGAAAALPKSVGAFRPNPDNDDRSGDNTACYLIVQRDGTAAGHPVADQIYVTVQYFIDKWKTQDETAIAGKTVAELADGFRPVSGVGDQAYVKDAQIWMRISNLTVNVRDAPADAEQATIEFARVLGRHLQSR
jgi:hypothetical protein